MQLRHSDADGLVRQGQVSRECSPSSAFNLPKLLYIGDVPVEASYHGSVLLYRLLESYPHDLLNVVEIGAQSQVARRLPNVGYHGCHYPLGRLQRTRLHRLFASALPWLSRLPISKAEDVVGSFRPQAILSVGHGAAWYWAWKLADRLKLPYHFIVHDDWPTINAAFSWSRTATCRRFGHVYRRAASRLCVSPFMIEEYARRYGADGVLLYPGRSRAVAESASKANVCAVRKPLRYAFAGTLNAPGFVEAIRLLVRSLSPDLGIVKLYGPFSPEDIYNGGFDKRYVEVCGLVPSSNIVDVLRREADVLFVPISHDSAQRTNMELHFPSKLVDYTATGLPILIFGPRYSSAVKWAAMYQSAFASATSMDELGNAVNALQNPAYRAKLGGSAFEVGQRLFDYSAIQEVFINAIRSTAERAGGGTRRTKNSGN